MSVDVSVQSLKRQQARALEELTEEALDCRYYVFHAWQHVNTDVLDKGWIDIQSECLRCEGTQSRLVNRRTGERLRPRTKVPTRTRGVGTIGTDVIVRAWVNHNVNGSH